MRRGPSGSAVLLLLTAVGCMEEVGPLSSPEPSALSPRGMGALSRAEVEGSPGEPLLSPGGQPFTIAVLPDTQFYAESYPQIFDAQTRWIVDNRESLGIALVLHEGDIVNNPDDPAQWMRASRSLRRLDRNVPYALARGNHDLVGGRSRIAGLMDVYFPPADFLRHAWFRETFEAGRMDNSFLLVEAGGQRWVVLALEFGPRDPVLAWANDILAEHRDKPAIIVTHAYLYGDDERYDHRRYRHQLYGPHDVPLEGGSNDGQEMWDELVARHDNLLFVLSGHVTEGGVGRLTSRRPSGTRCHQLLANYQTSGYGGDGFLRLLRVDPAAGTVTVRTYSPFLDTWKTDPANQFTLSIP